MDWKAPVTETEEAKATDYLAKTVLEEIPLENPIGFVTERLVPRYPEQPRALMTPTVWQSRDPATVSMRTPIHTPHEYFETVLTPDEAISLASDLLVTALKAKRFSAT